MSGRVVVTGLRELIAQFDAAPREMRDQGMVIVREETEQAAKDIAAQYPRKTGNLKSRVRTSYPASNVLVGVVRSAAPHSHLYEFGTRQRATRSGANRGRMPGDSVTPVIAQSRRRRMYRRLAELLRLQGFEVTGDV